MCSSLSSRSVTIKPLAKVQGLGFWTSDYGGGGGEANFRKWRSLPSGGYSHGPKGAASQWPSWHVLSRRAGIWVYFIHCCLGCATCRFYSIQSICGWERNYVESAASHKGTTMIWIPRVLGQRCTHTAENDTIWKTAPGPQGEEVHDHEHVVRSVRPAKF